MKKKEKKKEQLKKIQEQTVRLKDVLEAFLQKNSRKTKNYSPYFELWKLLKAINFGRMEMSEVVFGPTIICPYVKLDTMRDISICLTIIYTHINCRIKPNLMFISDEVQLHLNKFESQVEQFLFSWWRKDPKSISSEGPFYLKSSIFI